MSIDGSEGSILTRRESPGIHVYSNTFGEPAHVRGWRHITTVEPHLSELHYRKLAHLVDAVLDDQPLQLTGADGRDALALVDAVYRSADSGQPVDLSRERAGSGISAA
jgi:predicted dehydrogenase